MCISCLLQYTVICHKNFGEKLSLSFSFLTGLVTVGLPLFNLVFLQKNRFMLENEHFKQKWGKLFEK